MSLFLSAEDRSLFQELRAHVPDPEDIAVPPIRGSFEITPDGPKPSLNPNPRVSIRMAAGADDGRKHVVSAVMRLNDLVLDGDEVNEEIRRCFDSWSLKLPAVVSLGRDSEKRLGTRLEVFLEDFASQVAESTTGRWDQLTAGIVAECLREYLSLRPRMVRAKEEFMRQNYVGMFRDMAAESMRLGASEADLVRALKEAVISGVLNE